MRARVAAPDRAVESYLADVSAGGVFVRCEQPFPPGTALDVELAPPGRPESVKLTGKVVNTADALAVSAGGSGPGMGIAFDQVNADVADQLARLLREVGATDLRPPQTGETWVMVYMRGLLLELGDAQHKAQAAEREAAQARTDHSGLRAELGRARSELDVRGRRIFQLEQEKRALQASMEKLAKERGDLDRALAEQRRRSESPEVGSGRVSEEFTQRVELQVAPTVIRDTTPRPPPPPVPSPSESMEWEPREGAKTMVEFVEEPGVGSPAFVVEDRTSRYNIDPGGPEAGEPQDASAPDAPRAPTIMAEVEMPPEPRPPIPLVTLAAPPVHDTIPSETPAGFDPAAFLRRLNAGERMVPTPRFSFDSKTDPAVMLVATCVEKTATLSELRQRTAGRIGEARLMEILFDLFRRLIVEFERR